MDLDLANRVAVVTGGSRGIGKAIAHELAAEGCRVAVVARSRTELEETARSIAAETGSQIISVTADTGDDESVRAMVDQVVSCWGRVDILINGAARPTGIGHQPQLAEVTNDLFFDEMNIKVMGYLRCAREVAPHMAANHWGRIINVGGMAARQARAAVGSMRNVAVVALTKYLATELGPQGINVTVVHPLLVRTEHMLSQFQATAQAQGIAAEQVEKRVADTSSLQRLANPQEIAYVVAFLASPKSAVINGDVIAAGGGVGQAIYL
jgi:NAD(P)-dependent dehydrogenase (short-subunit alcohol dehydrogenase family)